MKKEIRYGSGPNDKARLSTIAEQQIAEIAAVTGENKNEVVAMAIAERYMRIVYCEQEKRIEDLQARYDEVYAALCDAANDKEMK